MAAQVVIPGVGVYKDTASGNQVVIPKVGPYKEQTSGGGGGLSIPVAMHHQQNQGIS